MMEPAKESLLTKSVSPASVKLEEKKVIWTVIITFSITLAMGLYLVISMITDILNDDPLLNLAQMEKRSGVITEVFKARIGRTNNHFFAIQTNDGESVRYLSHMVLQDQLKQLKGQQVTVWSIPIEFGWGWWSYENSIRQVQHQDHLILDYENEFRDRIKNNMEKAGNTLNITMLIFIFGVVIIPSIWIPIFVIRKVKAREAGENNNDS